MTSNVQAPTHQETILAKERDNAQIKYVTRSPKKPLVSKKIRSSGGIFLGRVAILVVAIAIWQFVAKYELLSPTVTSSPEAVFTWLWDAVTGTTMWANLGSTLYATILAWALGNIIGVTIGIALALLPTVEKLVSPYLSALNALPRIALAPLFIVAFGLTIESKVALGFSIVVFLAITNARAGVASVDIEHLNLANVLGASKIQRFFKILLPVAVPSIFGGMRLGLIYAMLGVLTAELMGSVSGIGVQLQEAAGMFRTDVIYGLLIVLALTATLLNALTAAVERYVLRWQTQ